MSQARDSNDVVDITVRLRGLSISVSGPAQAASQFVADITGTARASPRGSDSGSVGSFSVVSEQHQEEGLRRLETRHQIEASFAPCPGRLLQTASRLGGSLEVAEKRIRRAFLAGQWAHAVIEGRASSPNRSEQLPLRPRYYVVLRCDRASSPTVVTSSSAYFNLVGDLRQSSSISHSFPSETEARAYCLGARIDFPEVQQ